MHGHVLQIILSDRDRFAVSSPTSSPQNKRSARTGARSPKSPKTKQKSPKVKSRSKQPVPNIEITYANVKHNAKVKVEEPIYDNAKKPIYMNIGQPGEIYQPEREETQGLYDLDIGMMTLTLE